MSTALKAMRVRDFPNELGEMTSAFAHSAECLI